MDRRVLVALAAALLAGCGYVGDPLPPALNIPQNVTDLRAVQRGDKILVEFTAPALTTDSLAIRSLEAVDLRIGAIPKEFNVPEWAASAKQIPIAGDPAKPVRAELAASEWAGREVLIGVRTAARNGRYSDWATVAARVQAALLAPVGVRAEPHPDGIRVSWTAAGRGVSYRVFRDDAATGTAETPEYVDKAVALGKTYNYTVQAVRDGAESEHSGPVSVTAIDKFPPAVPAGLTAVTGVSSIELAWERRTEQDIGSYRVYRAEGTGEFTLLADAVEAPAYSDRQVTAGATYRYAVTAVDKTGNESARSTPAQTVAP